MRGYLVERLVIEYAHQLRLGWLAVRGGNLQRPLLLLSRGQTVAEGLPGDIQFLLRQRTGDAHHSGIALTLLHETIVQYDARRIFLLVGERQSHDAVAQLPGALLQQFVAGDDGIYDVRSVLRRAHLDIDRLAITRESLRRLIIPFGSWLHRMGILHAEERELLLQGILSADCLQLMNARFPNEGRRGRGRSIFLDRNRCIRLGILPFALINSIFQPTRNRHTTGIAVSEGHRLQTVCFDTLRKIHREDGWLGAQRQTHHALVALTADVGNDGRDLEVEETGDAHELAHISLVFS